MPIYQQDAWSIARKLGAEIKNGRNHPQAVIRYKQYTIGQFGIKRASRKTDHIWIAKQLYLSRKKTEELCRCTLSKDEYFDLLRDKGIIPSE